MTSIVQRSIHDFPTIHSLEQTLRGHVHQQEECQGIPKAAWELKKYDADTSIDNVNDPEAEVQRLQVLLSYNVLDSSSDPELDELTKEAQETCGTHMAAITIIDLGRQWTKSAQGLNRDAGEISRDISFCAHTIRRKPECGVLVVPDALEDSRFQDNPVVASPMGIRFYAGAPIKSPEGAVLGALCVFDSQPRPEGLSAAQQAKLQKLADCAMGSIVFGSS